jgi:hypothetical protein
MLLRHFFSGSEVELYEAEELSLKAFLSSESDFVVSAVESFKSISLVPVSA